MKQGLFSAGAGERIRQTWCVTGCVVTTGRGYSGNRLKMDLPADQSFKPVLTFQYFTCQLLLQIEFLVRRARKLDLMPQSGNQLSEV